MAEHPEQNAANTQTPNLVPPPQIENIEIITRLGQGGMSLVYLARQTLMDRLVAVKVLNKELTPDKEGILRFQNEAKHSSKLDHPNIIRTISFGMSTAGQPYLVMEYLEGITLADELSKNGRLGLKDSRRSSFLSSRACTPPMRRRSYIETSSRPTS